jgi:hypothetical protein
MFEDTDGFGQCHYQKLPGVTHCSDLCTTDEYVSEAQKRHYMAVLLQANRYRRDNHIPAWHKMPCHSELGKAIDFAVKYMKTL